MLQSLPAETTQLLIDLCTSTGPLLNDSTTTNETPTTKTTTSGPSYLSYLALNRSTTAATVVSSETAIPPSPSIKTIRPGADRESILIRRGESIYDAGSESAVANASVNTRSQQTNIPSLRIGLPTEDLPSPGAFPSAPVKRLSPKVYFHHFVDHLEQFVVFLETVAARRWGQSVDDQTITSPTVAKNGKGEVGDKGGLIEDEEELDKMDQVAVWNTLLELYLTLPSRIQDGGVGGKQVVNGSDVSSGGNTSNLDERSTRDKALRVLRSAIIPYDTTHALMLCSTQQFTLGMVHLYEKMGMYEDVLRFWMDKHNEGSDPAASPKVIEYLMLYGVNHPHLYPLVLRFLTSTPELLNKHQEDLKGILEYIDEEGLIPPLGVIHVLSRNGVASVGLVRNWLIKRIQESRTEIQNVLSSLVPSHMFLDFIQRTKILRNHIDLRQPLSTSRSQTSQTQTNLVCFMLRGVQLVSANWISLVFISCAIIHIIKGQPSLH